MAKYLYLDGTCGISGDMSVASLLDLGADAKKLDAVLQSLKLAGFDYKVSRKNSYSISGCDFDVLLHQPEHHHEEAYTDGHHHHEHRHLSDVYEIIDRGEMTDKARALAKRIFLIVAEAESKVHGVSLEEVHFHEVGAIDSIVDIISAAVLFDDLNIDECIVTGFNEGYGTVTCQHGVLPVPAPAVLNIAEKYGIPLRSSNVKGERVTPTGIAFAAAVRTTDKLPEEYRVLKSGVGLGKRDFGQASFLRSMIIEETTDDEQMLIEECNIDDSTGEELGLVQEKLFAAGAHDVHFVPCFMKKCRPAYLLRIITTAGRRATLEDIVFRNTTTIGMRRYKAEFTCMDREIIKVGISVGEALVKKCSYKDILRFYPEYESIKSLAAGSGKPFREIFEEARRKAEKQYGA